MPEILVDVRTGKVEAVRPDGHRWGFRESRAAYDEYIRIHGQAPRRTAIDVVTARPSKLNAAVRGELPIPVKLYMTETTRGIPVTPPEDFGIISVDGDIEAIEASVGSIAIDSDLKSSLLAGTVTLSLDALMNLAQRGRDGN